MTCLLVRKNNCTLKEARGFAKSHKKIYKDLSLKCKTVLIGIKLYYCFGTVPNEDTLNNLEMCMGFFSDIFFLSS